MPSRLPSVLSPGLPSEPAGGHGAAGWGDRTKEHQSAPLWAEETVLEKKKVSEADGCQNDNGEFVTALGSGMSFYHLCLPGAALIGFGTCSLDVFLRVCYVFWGLER